MKQLLNQVCSYRKHITWLVLRLVTMIILTCSLFATPVLATGADQMPNIASGSSTWVIDQADVISRANEGTISTTFENLAKQTGNEVRIITVRRLDYGETPESFTKALFEKWFPTKEAQANQTILMIDTVTNGTAIITGDKVKTVLPEEIAQSVANETVLVPLRKDNKYNQAFLDASDRLSKVLSGEPDPGPPQIVENVQVEGTFKKAEETDKGNATAWVIGLLIAATVIPMATYYIYQVFQPSSNG
ncbi:photosystem II repair protein Psb32 [Iningainema tapete]|uniref:TPM domain-containing protein n=1 Tax=Iningainema tapete BLCC-T55 TaxID=2748662 RepID=A0A8J7C6N5_9CYAN|nr:TPM domain-containing protein [Iningainema tapete]MBD2772216.1 TPM domain-containing protein [Iningainema tapete BLCC-T55]